MFSVFQTKIPKLLQHIGYLRHNQAHLGIFCSYFKESQTLIRLRGPKTGFFVSLSVVALSVNIRVTDPTQQSETTRDPWIIQHRREVTQARRGVP